MKCLVTGGTGFVGRRLVAALAARRDACRCLVRPTSDRTTLDGLPSVELVEGDLTRAETLDGVAEGVDAVFHLAAEGHVSAISKAAYQRFLDVNVRGTENLLRECARRDVGRFVHFSSTAAMGLIRKPVVDETDEPQPRTPYQQSKLASERAALAFCQDANGAVPVVVLRPCMIYGVGGKGEFHKFFRLMRKGLFPRVGLGKNLTPLVHVDDVVRGALKAAERGRAGEVYLIAGPRSYPLAELRQLILEACGLKRVYWYVPGWLMHAAAWGAELLAKITGRAPVVTRRNIANTVFDRAFSIAKARDELGYEPQVAIERGVAETVTWFLEEEKR